jgi:hypothetical protein
MRPLALFRSLMVLVTVSLIGACAAGTGEVVTVTPVQTGPLGGLKAEDRAKLEEIKKARGNP